MHSLARASGAKHTQDMKVDIDSCQTLRFCLYGIAVHALLKSKYAQSRLYGICQNLKCLPDSGKSNLTHRSLASFLWDIGKQCRPRSEHGV